MYLRKFVCLAILQFYPRVTFSLVLVHETLLNMVLDAYYYIVLLVNRFLSQQWTKEKICNVLLFSEMLKMFLLISLYHKFRFLPTSCAETYSSLKL